MDGNGGGTKKKKRTKVSIKVPPNKEPGHSVTFTNPHNPSQRLKAKVPKTLRPDRTFLVTVPMPDIEGGGGTDEENNDDRDRPPLENTFPQPLRLSLDDYSHAYGKFR